MAKKKGLKSIRAKLVYDEETKSVYIYIADRVTKLLSSGAVAKTRVLDVPINADYDKEGNLIGLEILGVDI